jgi:hypothetical protein|tara:strand:+ start:3167 stop:3616 length:450 start_codon:yes stop_codon:yes gene_type:complete
MAHFAKISEENVVLTVLYLENSQCLDENGVESETVGQQWLETHNNWPADKWIQTSYNTRNNQHSSGKTPLRGNYAGIGWTWDAANEIFWPPQPYASWTQNTTTADWDPPAPKPSINTEQQNQNDAGTHKWWYDWNESTQTWDLIDELAA